MKKILFALMVVLIASPAWAAVDVSVYATADGNMVTVGFNAAADVNVRAIALDITVDACGVIDDVNSLQDVADYNIYPGSAGINIEGGEVQGLGEPVGSTADHEDTQPGEGSQGVTIEMASLGAMPSGVDVDLVEILIVGCGDVNVAIAENAIRGGVVLEDPAVDPTLDITGCQVSLESCYDGCLPLAHADWANWDAMGQPDCWCAPPDGSGYQCDGDADGSTQTPPFNYRVGTNDLNVIVNNWKKTIGDPTINPCADIDHQSQTPPFNYQVGTNDLNILVTNWKKTDAGLPGDCPR